MQTYPLFLSFPLWRKRLALLLLPASRSTSIFLYKADTCPHWFVFCHFPEYVVDLDLIRQPPRGPCSTHLDIVLFFVVIYGNYDYPIFLTDTASSTSDTVRVTLMHKAYVAKSLGHEAFLVLVDVARTRGSFQTIPGAWFSRKAFVAGISRASKTFKFSSLCYIEQPKLSQILSLVQTPHSLSDSLQLRLQTFTS